MLEIFLQSLPARLATRPPTMVLSKSRYLVISTDHVGCHIVRTATVADGGGRSAR